MPQMADSRLFLREFVRSFHTTGAVLPSGRRLAAALARGVGTLDRPARVLEVGPGTGAVTLPIVERLGPEDRLDLVEFNAAFVERLRDRFAQEPPFSTVADRVRIIHGPVEELPGQATYDVVVSGLPLNNFSVAEVQGVIRAFLQLVAPGGMLSFFEYIAVRRLRALVSGRAERARLRGIGGELADLLAGREFRRQAVWLNVPPAWVHHLRFW